MKVLWNRQEYASQLNNFMVHMRILRALPCGVGCYKSVLNWYQKGLGVAIL